MSQDPMIVSCAYGCVGGLFLLAIVILIGSLAIQSVGLGMTGFIIVCTAALLGVVWRSQSAERKGK